MKKYYQIQSINEFDELSDNFHWGFIPFGTKIGDYVCGCLSIDDIWIICKDVNANLFMLKKDQLEEVNKKLYFKLNVERLGNKIVNNKFLYYLLNFTWGLPLTLLGLIVTLLLLPFGTFRKFGHIYYIDVSKFNLGNWGFAMGTTFVTSWKLSDDFRISNLTTPAHLQKTLDSMTSVNLMRRHEFGHTVQNAMFGPFMIFLVAIPSVIRYWYRLYRQKKKMRLKGSYDSVWYEGSASTIGGYYNG